jgi:HlyD family secretion protein
MKKGIVGGILIILVVAGSFLAFRFFKREKPLVLSGSIEARDVEVGSLIGGRIRAVHVKEGDTVHTGQVLLELESDLLDMQILEQQSRIAEANANLARIQKGPRTEELMRAKIDWQSAEGDLLRQKELLDQGIIGKQAYDIANTKAQTAKQFYLEQEKGSRSEDIAAAQAAVAREEGHLKYLEKQRDESIIKASVDGTIEAMDLRPGDLLPANQAAVRILESTQKWVRVYVPEPMLGAIRIGQHVKIKVDTYPNRTFAGQVSEINQHGEYTPRNVQTLNQRYDQVFGVKVRMEDTPELKPGMAATVEL